MKKTNKNKSTPHGITLRRFVKINFYFIQEILIPIQTIRDMEGKCQKMSIQCSCHEFPGPFSLYFFFFFNLTYTWNIPLFWLRQRLKVTFFSNCHSSRELHLKSLNSISVPLLKRIYLSQIWHFKVMNQKLISYTMYLICMNMPRRIHKANLPIPKEKTRRYNSLASCD